jgi:hypothetical protein
VGARWLAAAGRGVRRRRLDRLAALIAISVARVASADEPVYPTVFPDRPILPLPGMTELELGLDFPHFDDAGLYAALGHAFGPVYVAVFGPGLEARLDTGTIPAVISVSIAADVGLPDHEYHRFENFQLAHKLHLRPGLAVFVDAELSLQELNSNSLGRTTPGHAVFADADGELEDQIADRIAIDAGLAIWAPVSESFTQQDHTKLDASLEVIREFDTWDAYASLSLNDTTSDPYLTGSVGFQERWGATAAPRTPR